MEGLLISTKSVGFLIEETADNSDSMDATASKALVNPNDSWLVAESMPHIGQAIESVFKGSPQCEHLFMRMLVELWHNADATKDD